MIIKTLPVGPIMANCYIVGCEETQKAAVIDPGGETDKILKELARLELSVEYIINTHGHFDHVGGNRKLKQATGAKLLIHILDQPMLDHLPQTAAAFGLSAEKSPAPDQTIQDGDLITFGQVSFKVIHTPGHSQGGVCLFGNGVIFVGDSLFKGSIGRTDLPGGDYNALIESINQKIFPLGDEVRVLTGHGSETTIGEEKRSNPFVGQH